MEVYHHEVFLGERTAEKSSEPKFFHNPGDKIPRKRGRPRKQDISLNVQKQNVQKAPAQFPEQFGPRKRGRPRKYPLNTAVVPRKLDTSEITSPRPGPGRPRKILPRPEPQEDSNDGLSDINQILANCASYTELELPPSLFN